MIATSTVWLLLVAIAGNGFYTVDNLPTKAECEKVYLQTVNLTGTNSVAHSCTHHRAANATGQ